MFILKRITGDNKMIKTTLIAINKEMGIEIYMHIFDMPQTDAACSVICAFSQQLFHGQKSGLKTNTTAVLTDFMQSMGCFGGVKNGWEIQDLQGNNLIFLHDGSHHYVSKCNHSCGWKNFLCKVFNKNTKNKPMATKRGKQK